MLLLSTLSVGSPATEIIRRDSQYMYLYVYSFSKDTLHFPKMQNIVKKNNQDFIQKKNGMNQNMNKIFDRFLP